MRKLPLNILFLTLLVCATNSFAFDVVQNDNSDVMDSYLNYQGIEPIKEINGAVKWKVFEGVKEIKVSEENNGLDNVYTKPEYSEEVKKLDKTKIKLYGFLFPLSEGDKQNNFLLGAFPLTCPFHYHVSPKMVIEINTKEPIKFTYDPVLLEGIFEVKYNEETQIFYYLNDADIVD